MAEVGVRDHDLVVAARDGDRDLVVAARDGDRDAFAELAHRHRPLALATATRMVGDPATAEEAVQEALLVAWTSLDRLREPASFGSWLTGIALNVCRGSLRYEARKAWSLEAVRGGVAGPEPSWEVANPADLVEYRELVGALLEAVRDLPAGQRDAVVAYYFRGLTQVEAATLLGTTATAVKTRLAKARRALRDALIPHMEERLMPDRAAVTVGIAGVIRLPATEEGFERHIVLLEDAAGGRKLPIYVGEHEGIALAFALERPDLPRPLTHELTAALLEAASARLRSVTVTKLVEGTFYASLALDVNGESVEVDGRPSDGLILAALTGAEVRVAEDVLTEVVEAHGRTLPSVEELEAEAVARTPQIVTERLELIERATRSAC
ncbi:MAG: bifunctional nuclease domain-containing protein [Nitriliruptorales bacterium]